MKTGTFYARLINYNLDVNACVQGTGSIYTALLHLTVDLAEILYLGDSCTLHFYRSNNNGSKKFFNALTQNLPNIASIDPWYWTYPCGPGA